MLAQTWFGVPREREQRRAGSMSVAWSALPIRSAGRGCGPCAAFSSWNPLRHCADQPGRLRLLLHRRQPGEERRAALRRLRARLHDAEFSNCEVQVTKTIGPGSSGWTDWKEALWTLNYLQIMHDDVEVAVDSVPDAQVARSAIGEYRPGSIHPGTNGIEQHQLAFRPATSSRSSTTRPPSGCFSSPPPTARRWWFCQPGHALDYSLERLAVLVPVADRGDRTADASGFPMPSRYAIASAGQPTARPGRATGAYASIYALTDLEQRRHRRRGAAEVSISTAIRSVQNQTADGSPPTARATNARR